VVEIRHSETSDHVAGTAHDDRLGHPFDRTHLIGNASRPTQVGLDEDERVQHALSPFVHACGIGAGFLRQGPVRQPTSVEGVC
jgi:hypothetical protein